MLGQTTRLADNLWFIQGEMPDNVDDAPDWCNVVLYRAGGRLYLIDSGGGPVMRNSIDRLLDEIGPVESFTLINTHSHLDHICNNDLISQVDAGTKHHYLLRAGMREAKLDAPGYFADQFDRMDEYYDPFTGYPVNRKLFRVVGLLRDGLGRFVGRQRVLRWLFKIQFKKFNPVNDSRQTMEALDDEPTQILDLGAASWNGWRLGEDDMFVLESPAHSGDDVLVYIPEHRMLCMGDVTFPLFPTWQDSSRDKTVEGLEKTLRMVRSGDVTALADGHGDQCYRGRDQIETLLQTVLGDHLAYEEIIGEIFEEIDGQTPAEVYRAFTRFDDRAVVSKYLALEFPHTPASLQNIMVTTMLQLGYRARGKRRHQRFYRPTP